MGCSGIALSSTYHIWLLGTWWGHCDSGMEFEFKYCSWLPFWTTPEIRKSWNFPCVLVLSLHTLQSRGGCSLHHALNFWGGGEVLCCCVTLICNSAEKHSVCYMDLNSNKKIRNLKNEIKRNAWAYTHFSGDWLFGVSLCTFRLED